MLAGFLDSWSVCMSDNSSTRCGCPIMDISIKKGLEYTKLLFCLDRKDKFHCGEEFLPGSEF